MLIGAIWRMKRTWKLLGFRLGLWDSGFRWDPGFSKGVRMKGIFVCEQTPGSCKAHECTW